jgi:hypothetical protein
MFKRMSHILSDLTKSSNVPSANPTPSDIAPYETLTDTFGEDTFQDETPTLPREAPKADLTIPPSLLKKEFHTSTSSTLIPFENAYLKIAPDLKKIADFDKLTLRELIDAAKKGENGVELLLALHRYMAVEMNRGFLNRLDCVSRDRGKQEKRLRLLMAYDQKYEIKRVKDILIFGSPSAPPGQYRGPI